MSCAGACSALAFDQIFRAGNATSSRICCLGRGQALHCALLFLHMLRTPIRKSASATTICSLFEARYTGEYCDIPWQWAFCADIRNSSSPERRVHVKASKMSAEQAQRQGEVEGWTPPAGLNNLDQYYWVRHKAMMQSYYNDQREKAFEAAQELLLVCIHLLGRTSVHLILTFLGRQPTAPVSRSLPHSPLHRR